MEIIEMEKIKKILIPTDGSDCSLRAATVGISFAKNCNGEIYAIYIVAKKEGVKAEAILAKGEPHDQIVFFAKSKGIDMIVMGTYGRRGTKRILIGSVTERVIEYAPCPVLVVK
jgi:nucleotide-binding universal stress UspA family protein